MKIHAATVVLLIWFCFPAAAQQTGAALYAQRCVQCHDSSNKDIRAPSRTVLKSKSFDEVLSAITTGTMASFAQGLTNDERTAIASLVTGKVAEAPHATADKSGQCAQNEAGFSQAIDGPERLGRGSQQQPVSTGRDGWHCSGPGSPTASEMGVRISPHNQRQRSANRCRRFAVCGWRRQQGARP